MNIAEYSIKRSVVIWMIIVLLIGGGIYAYRNLARYEDPEFTIKDAIVLTPYPGATPLEVEKEVTDRVEKAIQQMGQVKKIKSISRPGESEITVTMKDKYNKKTLPQVWDELRRKVHDVQGQLPPGAGPSLVNDDYGDVYGMFYAVTGEGFSYRELKDYVDLTKKELSLVPGVAKVVIAGERKEAIFVDISRAKMSQLGISLKDIYDLLRSQNTVLNAGSVKVGREYIRIEPTGLISTVQAIGDLLIRSQTTKKLIYLSDIATVKRGYEEVPKELMFYNGKRALGLGISIVEGGNVVKIGEAVKNELIKLKSMIPVGIRIDAVYEQPSVVKASIRGFMVSLIEALVIVIVVLLIFMGVRSGFIIAAILWLTVFGTLAIMYLFNLDLQRISLGALIIALGMLVDNAIVVTEGILVKTQAGIDKIIASRDVVAQTMWPLLGATIVGILAFAPISLSQDSTGEYTVSLFYVILISLLLSWLLAVTVAPLFSYLFLKKGDPEKIKKDPYDNFLYKSYRAFLKMCLRLRWPTVFVMVGLLAISIYGFGYVKQSFFPNSTTPMFYVNYWETQGTDIRVTTGEMIKIEKHIKKISGVSAVTSIVGKGALRFLLVYTPEKTNSGYGQFLVRVDDYRNIDKISDEVKQYILKNYPDSEPKIEKIRLGPGGGAKIEARFSGPDPKVLRELSEKAKQIMRETPGAIDIRDDWRQRVKIIEPVFSEQRARATGITREDLNRALETAFSGKQVGIYREEDKLIPIISRPPDIERLNIKNIDDLQIWSDLLQRTVPVGQVVTNINTVWEDSLIHRRNRKPTITVSCEPASGPASLVFNALKPKIENIKLPAGYSLAWGGEYEDSHDAQVALASKIPGGIILMFVVVVLLFGSLRQPLIIWACVPLAIIGVTAGLLLTNTEFGFMALLGFLSLSGMLIKNAIVLIDQIDLEIKQGKEEYSAIVDSSISRFRPVMLAAVTTVLGMIPLLFDAFFQSMAIVIMFGLSFATVLTLIVVPVLYSLFGTPPKKLQYNES